MCVPRIPASCDSSKTTIRRNQFLWRDVGYIAINVKDRTRQNKVLKFLGSFLSAIQAVAG